MSPSVGRSESDWTPYLEAFHRNRAGITEEVLARCHHDGDDPYDWAARPLADQPGPVLDVACGSGPMAGRVVAWMGTDTSDSELTAAQAQDRGPLVRGSATLLPMATASVGAAVCSMSMQIIDPLSDAFAELARILRRGGVAVLLLPAGRPLPWRHAITYLRLQIVLRTPIRYPNDHALTAGALAPVLESVGLTIASDQRLPFAFPLGSPSDADALLRSLYLPGVDPHRLERARRLLAAHVGGELTVPLRRVVLSRTVAAT